MAKYLRLTDLSIGAVRWLTIQFNRNQNAHGDRMKYWQFAAMTLFFGQFYSTTFSQDRYALVVGVETYDTSTFDNLEYAAEDAEQLGASLKNLGFQTTIMTSESRSTQLRPSTPKKIVDRIAAVSASCANGDTLLISLSGHGVQFSDEELLGTGVRETYFCPSDADLTNKDSLLGISSVINAMNNSAAGRKLLLVDACQEQVLSAEGRRKGARRIELGSVHENRRSVPGGMAVLFSCSSGQFSWEHEPIAHSVFTYHVIEYLNGKADQRFYDAEQIDLSGLVFYVSKRTNDYVIGKNLSADGQLPVMRGSSANWPLGKLDPKSQRMVFENSLGMKMLRIAGGFHQAYDWKPGSQELEIRRVETKSLCVSERKVTVGDFRRFVESTGYVTVAELAAAGQAEKLKEIGLLSTTGLVPGQVKDFYGSKRIFTHGETPERDLRLTWKNAPWRQAEDHPVLNLSTYDVSKFLSWLGDREGRSYRLMTDLERQFLEFGHLPYEEGYLNDNDRGPRAMLAWQELESWLQLEPTKLRNIRGSNFLSVFKDVTDGDPVYATTTTNRPSTHPTGLVGLLSNYPEYTSNGLVAGSHCWSFLTYGQCTGVHSAPELIGFRPVLYE
jgi:formylglycine-generating enzyme required for sulfatase activity